MTKILIVEDNTESRYFLEKAAGIQGPSDPRRGKTAGRRWKSPAG